MICKICNCEVSSLYGLARHLTKTHLKNHKEYYDSYLRKGKEGICSCGKNTRFRGLSGGYVDHCSKRCSWLDPQIVQNRKITVQNRYGVEVPMRNLEVLKRSRQTCLKNFGYESATKHPLIKKKISKKSKDTIIKHILNSKMKFERPTPIIGIYEQQCLDELSNFLKIEIKRNVQFGHFWVDGFIPQKSLVIEFDEEHHFKDGKLCDHDARRQIAIESSFDVSFFRISKVAWLNHREEIKKLIKDKLLL